MEKMYNFNFLKMKGQATSNHKGLLLLLCWMLSGLLHAQEPDSSLFRHMLSIPVEAKLIATDKLQNLYVVTPSNELVKYLPTGQENFRYNDNSLGELKVLDVTNPFNLLLYYPEYLTVTTLDRTLSKTGDYLLYDLDVTDVQAVGLSNDNNVWLYDDTTFKLKKIKNDGTVIVESNDLSMLLNKNPSPNFILERNNWVYVNEPQFGILVFDIFGQYVRSIPIKGLTAFSIVEDQLLYLCEQHLCGFHLKSLLYSKFALPAIARSADHISFQRNKLFVARQDQVEVYSLVK